jgi:hypothetical protein
MILGDNSPYNLKSLKKHAQNLKFTTFWFPYNGYAQDYPLCYDNLSFFEKKKISLNLNLNREKILLKAIKILDPEYLIPHSSDFALNGPRRKEFYRVHSKEFLNKEMYAKRIEKITKKKVLALFGGDTLTINKKNFIIDKRTNFAESVRLPREIKLTFPKADKNRLTLKEEFELSIKAMNERATKYKIPKTGIKKWIFQIETKSEKLYANLENGKVYNKNPDKKKYIIKLKTSRNIIRCIMQKKIHLNNAVIGNYLSWERNPNIYNKYLWDMFSFFQAPLKKISYSK